MDVFATLRRGEALFLGESVMMPTRIKIDLPCPTPDSNDIKFSEIWNQPHEKIDFECVLDEWRRQGGTKYFRVIIFL